MPKTMLRDLRRTNGGVVHQDARAEDAGARAAVFRVGRTEHADESAQDRGAWPGHWPAVLKEKEARGQKTPRVYRWEFRRRAPSTFAFS